MWTSPQETVDLVSFTEEILNGKLQFLCSDWKNMLEILWKFTTRQKILFWIQLFVFHFTLKNSYYELLLALPLLWTVNKK